MALKKSEMEFHRDEYYALIDSAREAIQQGIHVKAVELAVSSWEHIDGMMQYERRYESKSFDSIEGIDIVLNYAPLLLDFHALERLELLLRSQRRIDKHASDDLAGKLSEARGAMWNAHRVWSHLEQSDCTETLSLEDEPWRSILDSWESIEITTRKPDDPSGRPVLRTQMDGLTCGKCPSCAAVVRARKARLLEESSCPKCRAVVNFVLLPDGQESTN